MVSPYECEIIFKDEHLVAINKPYGYFVHKSSLDATSDKILMKLLRDQLGQYVYPVHRLDRKTTGVLLFALDKESLALVNRAFEQRSTTKFYLAICRGFMPENGSIDHPLLHESGKIQEAKTLFTCLQHREINIPSYKFQTSRYSLIVFQPLTGRMHQIRRHAAHIFHPIIGDRPHGCNKQNKLLLETFQLSQMLLHAFQLKFDHPYHKKELTIQAAIPEEFIRIMAQMNFDHPDLANWTNLQIVD
ncbi:MAG: pseudouridylate synthase [Saprospiraceae bacterium]|nr:pseudouridylate synthase [Saprospiraceae bacterium]